jgi:tetratricopeptide (TPR) repeat protein
MIGIQGDGGISVGLRRKALLWPGRCVLLAILAGSGCAVQPAPPIQSSVPEIDVCDQVRGYVADLGYSQQTAEDLVAWVRGWRAGRGMEILDRWAGELSSGRQGHSTGVTSARDVAATECRIAEQLLDQVRLPLRYDVETFELGDVIAKQQAQCLGMAQVYWILARSVGLPAVPLDVLATDKDHPLPPGQAHICCAVNLADHTTLILDGVSQGQVYGPCQLSDLYLEQGLYLSLRDCPPLSIPFQRVRVLDASGLRAHLVNARAGQLARLGRLQEALALYTEAIHQSPDLALAWGNRAVVSYKLGEFRQAIADCNQAIDLDPDSARTLNTRASCYVRMARLGEALLDLDRAVTLDDRLAMTFYNRGNVNTKLNRLHEAVRDYTRAIALAPGCAEAHFGLGNAFHRLGRFEDAARCYTRAIGLDPSLNRAYANRGLSYALLGRDKASQQDLAAAAEAGLSQADSATPPAGRPDQQARRDVAEPE